MFKLEMYKIFKRKMVCITLVAIFIFILFSVVSTYEYQFSNYERLLDTMNYYEQNKGVLTDDRIKEFGKGYTFGDFDYYIENRFFINGEQVPVKKLYPEINFDIQFGYFQNWAYLFEDLTSYLLYVPAFIVIAFAPLFAYENQCGMQEILLTTKKGRKKCTKAKIVSAFLITNILNIIVLLFTIVPFYITTKGIGGDTSIQMTPWIMNSQLEFDYKTLLIHTIILSFLSVNVILLITLYASFLAKSPMVAMSITLGVLFVWRPEVMDSYIDVEILKRITSITPLNILDSGNLAKQVPIVINGVSFHMIIIAEIIYTIVFIGGVLFFVKILTKHQKYYAS